jgi:hypothetical protein
MARRRRAKGTLRLRTAAARAAQLTTAAEHRYAVRSHAALPAPPEELGMNVRCLAIPLFAAICVGSPILASGNDGTGGDEQRRRDRGADNRRYGGRSGPRPRVAVPVVRPNIYIANRGPRFYGPAYYHRWARSYYRWSPIGYAPWGLISAGVGFSNFSLYGSFGPAYGHGYPYYAYPPYGYAPPYAYPYPPAGYDFGGVRLALRPRDAQVFVDGNYAGIVDDFDGTFQQLRLDQGGHKIEIRMPGFEDLELDVHVAPGRTLTIRENLRPRP